ncbi:MAG: SctK family type III secretion system sorting platform protein [Victivallales bacterium]|nr:SctK family type III secretion system sorting platform protein [Victivallales bacterium]
MTEQGNIEFTRLQLQFLGNPLDLADGGRVAELLKPFNPDGIKPCPQAWLRLQTWAEQQWQVPSEMFDFQAHPLGRYLLMPIEQTRRMAEWLGVLAYYPIIRVTLKGEILNALKHELPNCYPDVLRHARAFQKWQPSLSASVTDKTLSPSRIRSHGLGLLLTMFVSIPSSIIRRWKLRFPAAEIDDVEPVAWPADAEADKQLLEELNHRGLLGV